MSLDYRDKRAASYLQLVRPELKYTDNPEHLSIVSDLSVFDEVDHIRWNRLIETLADAAKHQPFGDPYYWQQHQRHDFVKWLKSWKV